MNNASLERALLSVVKDCEYAKDFIWTNKWIGDNGSFGVGDGRRCGACTSVVVAWPGLVATVAAGEPDFREPADVHEPGQAAESMDTAPLAVSLRLPGE